MKNNILQVFEHEYLRVGEGPDNISKLHFEALCRYFDTNSKYFSLGRKKIKFNYHVGVIQVGGLTIEVLPKSDKANLDKHSWHNKLIEILKFTKRIRAYKSSDSSLRLRSGTLMDLYLSIFLDEVSELLRVGLRKRYRKELRNLNCVKGQIHFSSNISKNLYNKARVSCKTTTYDHNHLIHTVLMNALEIIEFTTTSQPLKRRAKALKIEFPDNIEMKLNIHKLEQIELNRHTKRYQEALNLAKLIIKSYSPDISFGKCPVLAFMFDMNHLYEEFIFKISRSVAREMGGDAFRRRNIFWETKCIKPDIIVELPNQKIILDTKWKMLDGDMPSDADLKQMFVYSEQFNTISTYLIYPFVSNLSLENNGVFHNSCNRCVPVGLPIEDDLIRPIKNKLRLLLSDKAKLKSP